MGVGRGVGKQVFVAPHPQAPISIPLNPLFLREKPGRIEALCEYPALEVFRTIERHVRLIEAKKIRFGRRGGIL